MNKLLFLILLLTFPVLAHADFQQSVYPTTWKYASIATAATTTVKTGQGILHNILVTGGSAGTITLYNNTIASSDTVIATFSSTNAIANYPFDVSFSSGCTVVTGGNTNLTVTYQ